MLWCQVTVWLLPCRYGESLHELMARPAGEPSGSSSTGLASWRCLHCRGICNAGACRLRQGLCHVNHTQAVAAGFKSVAHWLITSNQQQQQDKQQQEDAAAKQHGSEQQAEEMSQQQQGQQQEQVAEAAALQHAPGGTVPGTADAEPQQQGCDAAPGRRHLVMAAPSAPSDMIAAGKAAARLLSKQTVLSMSAAGSGGGGGVSTRRQLLLQGHVTRAVARQLL